MFEFLKHINPKIKILSLSLILILLPGAIISYLSLKSIQEKADNQRIKYQGTANLVRDKLESELFQLETNFRNRFIDSILSLESETEIQTLLQLVDIEYPAFKKLLLLGNNGELIANLVTCKQNNVSSSDPFIISEVKREIALAERQEFIVKNYIGAIDLYQKVKRNSLSLKEIVIIQSRIGRNYYKSGQYEKGIAEYEKILELSGESTSIGNIPASIVALYQIAAGFQELSELNDRNKTIIELYRQLLNNPWDLLGGEYLFYLKATLGEIREIEESLSISNNQADIISELRNLEERIIDQSAYLNQFNREILGELMSDLKHLTSSEINHKSYQTELDRTIGINYFILPPAISHPQLKALAFEFDENYLLKELFSRVLSTVELGKDLTVGILNENDSLLFIRNDIQISNHLVAQNFTQFFPSWKVALFDITGRSIEQMTGRERHLYLLLFIGILAVMLIGIIVLARAVVHESEVSRMKSEFVSNVTHELKTPLALIRMFGETLDSGIVTDEGKRREFYSIIRKESERLTHLINNVLDFSRTDTGSKEYNFEDTDLAEVVRHSLEAYKFHIRDSGFEIKSTLPKVPVMVSIDKDAISQAFLNLLSNAVKYSDNEKYIVVEVSQENDTAKISVTDHGIGIAKAELKKIFDKFYRVNNNMLKPPRGSGLGLTLSRHIVKAHSGRIEVDSEQGKGSRFMIWIPMS